MEIIELSYINLLMAALLIIAVVIMNLIQQLQLTKSLIVSAIRAVIQLIFIGFILQILFDNPKFIWVVCLAFIMLFVASREVIARQENRFKGWWDYSFTIFSLLIVTFGVAVFSLKIVIGATPWYAPQYAIPLLGMIIGNAMTGVSLSLNALTKMVWLHANTIEQRLLLGQTAKQAMADFHRSSVKTGMIPSINAMAVAGIVILPGMMTGQILAGISPIQAVKYQIVIMFMLTAASSCSIMLVLWLSSKRLFDDRQRLRLDRLLSRY